MSEIKTITTPSGIQAELKPRLNAGERNKFRRVFLSDADFGLTSEKAVTPKITGEVLEKAEHTALELVVIKYNGATEKILERVLEGTPEDYDFLVKQATEIVNFTQPR